MCFVCDVVLVYAYLKSYFAQIFIIFVSHIDNLVYVNYECVVTPCVTVCDQLCVKKEERVG